MAGSGSSLAQRPTEKDAQSGSEKDEQTHSILARLPVSERTRNVLEWFLVAFGIYVLITAVGLIGDGFSAATGGRAEELFGFAENPFVGLAIGILATVLTQSSSTTTSIVVGMVAGGLPLGTAIPILMGANVGTTVTSTLVSLGAAGDREQFRRGFSAASVHDMYNLLALVIFLPIEMMFGLLERVSTWFAGVTAGTDGGAVSSVFGTFGDVVSAITDPGADLIGGALTSFLPEVWAGIAMILVGVALILLVIRMISKLLKLLLVGQAEKIFHSAIGRGPVSGVLAGLFITVLVQSSSTTTSLAVPLAASGKFQLREIFPFTVGANIGTTMTAIIAAFGFSGIERTAGMTAATVHLLYNAFAMIVIMGIPFLRPIPVKAAVWIGDLGARNKLYVVMWVLGVFVAVPGVMILLTSVF
ncbi:Na/Pi cotransporter family protein [Kocuria marina subsp. indica]|uniref:Na/Pi symporter n=1 Tax=Kocuria TaxID=57493 RepID=UPI00103F973A|nr:MULTISPECIES: Na/Pi symporter [Kocuria]MDT0119176.1 Na/Pi symporter [Kocuria sp. PD6]QBJ20898.1 Na/Pi cotransporter family protein [Kocuria indica]